MTRSTLQDRHQDLLYSLDLIEEQVERADLATSAMIEVLRVMTGCETVQEFIKLCIEENLFDAKTLCTEAEVPSEVESTDKSEVDCPPLPVPEQEQPKVDPYAGTILEGEGGPLIVLLEPNLLPKPVIDPPKRWSQTSDRCIDCRSAEKPHGAHGRCKVCDSRWRRALSVTGTPAKELEAKSVEALKQASKVVDVPRPEPDPEDPRKRQKTSKGVLDLYPHIVESADRQKFSFVVRSIRNADRTTNEIVARDHLREATDAAVCTLQTLQQFRNKHLYRFQKLASTSSSSDVNGLLQDWYRDMEIEAATS